MKYVLDASVALRWVLPDALTDKALQLRADYQAGVHKLVAPDVFVDEMASALTKAERQKIISVGQAAALYAKVMNLPPILVPHLSLLDRAIDLSSQTRSSFYDCLYVALAELEACPMLTADKKLFKNLQSRFAFVLSLSSLP